MNQFQQFNHQYENFKTKISYPKEFCSPVKYFCHNLDSPEEDEEELLCPWKTDDIKNEDQLSQTNGQIMRKKSQVSKKREPISSKYFPSSLSTKQHRNILPDEENITKQLNDVGQSSTNQQVLCVESNFLELFDKQKRLLPPNINKSQHFNAAPTSYIASTTTYNRNKRSNTFSNGILNRLQTESFDRPQLSKIDDPLLIQDNSGLCQQLQPISTGSIESSNGIKDPTQITPHRKIIDFISTLRTELLSRSNRQKSILEAALAGQHQLPPKQLFHKQIDQNQPQKNKEKSKEDSLLRSNSVFVYNKRSKLLKDSHQKSTGSKHLRKLLILDENSSLTTIPAQREDPQVLTESEKEKHKLRVYDVNVNRQKINFQEKGHLTTSQQGKVFEFSSYFENLGHPLKVFNPKEDLGIKNNLYSPKKYENAIKNEDSVAQAQQSRESCQKIKISKRNSQFQESVFSNQFNPEENRQSSPVIYIKNEDTNESENSPICNESKFNYFARESALLNGLSEFKGKPSDLFRKNTIQKKSAGQILNKSFDCITSKSSDFNKSKLVFGSIAHHLKEAITKEKDQQGENNLLVSNIINQKLSLEAKQKGGNPNKSMIQKQQIQHKYNRRVVRNFGQAQQSQFQKHQQNSQIIINRGGRQYLEKI